MLAQTMMGGHGKYRVRSWLRERLPLFLADHIAKGRKSCGNHAWYPSDDGTLRCYYCEAVIRRVGEPSRPMNRPG